MSPTSANIQPAQLSHHSCIFPPLLYKITPQSLTVFPLSALDLWLQLQAFLHAVRMPADIFCNSAALPSQLLAQIPSMSAAEDPSLHILRYQALLPTRPTPRHPQMAGLPGIHQRWGKSLGDVFQQRPKKTGKAALPTKRPPGMAQRAASAVKGAGGYLPNEIFTICLRGFPSLRTEKTLGHV